MWNVWPRKWPRDDKYVVESAGASVRDRAQLALQMGLAGKALNMLLESDVSAFGPVGMELQLELLLGMGRPKDVREWMMLKHKEALGAPSYHRLRICALAASGDYTGAEDECVELIHSSAGTSQGQEATGHREIMALLLGRAVLDAPSAGGTLPFEIRRPFGRVEFGTRLANQVHMLRRDAEVTVLGGLLALEEGDVEEAAFAFRDALAVWKDEASAASGAGLDFGGRAMAQTCLKWLE